MGQTSATYRSHCPINFVLETFGDKWTLLIVRDLMFNGKTSFRQFLKSDEGIATNILSDRLKRLEENGIVEKTEDEANRSKLNYSLTKKGKDLMPIMLEITAWSAKHDKLTNTPRSFRKTLATDREAMISVFMDQLEQ